MKKLATFIRVNIHGHGSIILWAGSAAPLPDSQIDDLIPRPLDDLYGPNICTSLIRLSDREFLLCTRSRWDITEQYGRKGLTLSHGIWFKSGDDADLHGTLCEIFLALCGAHEKLYARLGLTLQHIATIGDIEGGNGVATQLHDLTSRGFILEDGFHLWLKTKVDDLVKSHKRERIRLFSDLSDSSSLGICLLIGLLTRMPPNSRVGGGYLKNPEAYQHIASGQDVTGFTAKSIGHLLTNTSNRRPSISMGDIRLDKPSVNFLWSSRLAQFFLNSLSAIVAILLMGWITHDSLQKSIGSSEARLAKTIEDVRLELRSLDAKLAFQKKSGGELRQDSEEPRDTPTPYTLEGLIADLFKMDRRDAALAELTSNWATDSQVVDKIMDHIENSLDDSLNNRWGVVYSLRFLAVVSTDQLTPRRARLEALLSKVQALGRPKATEAAKKVSLRLSTIEP